MNGRRIPPTAYLVCDK